MSTDIVVIPGDGIGKEVVPATIRVLEALDREFTFIEANAGDAVLAKTGSALPDETKDAVSNADATLFGAAGETAADVILPLRQAVDSFANLRPARAFPGVDALHPETDLVFVRENTEGVYSGIESEIVPGVTTLTRVISERASRRIAEYAFEFARSAGYKSVTIAHKANVMRVTDGLFLETARDVATKYDDITTTEAIMDALAMHLVMRPTDYDVIVCPNLAGDMLSDLAAGLVGGLGLLPSANIGPDRALFEPVHGTAPDIAGQGIANPTATILSAAMMLDFLGYRRDARSIRTAVIDVLKSGPHTPDLGGNAATHAVTDAVIDHL